MSSAVVLNDAAVEAGVLKIRAIRIDDFGYVGTSSVLTCGTHIESWGNWAISVTCRPDARSVRGNCRPAVRPRS